MSLVESIAREMGTSLSSKDVFGIQLISDIILGESSSPCMPAANIFFSEIASLQPSTASRKFSEFTQPSQTPGSSFSTYSSGISESQSKVIASLVNRWQILIEPFFPLDAKKYLLKNLLEIEISEQVVIKPHHILQKKIYNGVLKGEFDTKGILWNDMHNMIQKMSIEVVSEALIESYFDCDKKIDDYNLENSKERRKIRQDAYKSFIVLFEMMFGKYFNFSEDSTKSFDENIKICLSKIGAQNSSKMVSSTSSSSPKPFKTIQPSISRIIKLICYQSPNYNKPLLLHHVNDDFLIFVKQTIAAEPDDDISALLPEIEAICQKHGNETSSPSSDGKGNSLTIAEPTSVDEPNAEISRLLLENNKSKTPPLDPYYYV